MKRILVSIGLIFTLISGEIDFVNFLYAASFRKGPYLIYQGINSNMTVLWQTDSTPSNSATIEWGATTSYGNGPFSVTESGSGSNEHQFSYTINNLTPGSITYYRVTVDGKQITGSLLAAPSASATSVTLYAFGDTRDDGFRGNYNRVCARILQDVDASPGIRQTICLHSGDWVTSGNNEQCWDDEHFNRSYVDALEFMSRVAIMGCRDGHDGNGVLFRKYLPFAYAAGGSRCYHSFDYGPVHITVLDQDVDYSEGSSQYNWLVNEIANTTKKFNIVVFHKPAWSSGGIHGNNTTAQRVLCPLLEAGGVDVVINGNNHYYCRCEVNGIQHITSGGGGQGLYRFEPGYPNVVTVMNSNYHFVKIAVNDNIMNVTAIDVDGNVFDSFSIITDYSGELQISQVQVSNITGSGATITWKTNWSATSEIEYGKTISYGSTTGEDSAEVTDHSMDLTNLDTDSVYYYKLISSSGSDTATYKGSFTVGNGGSPPPPTTKLRVINNIFNPENNEKVKISLTLANEKDVRIRIYTLSGKLVRTILSESKQSGSLFFEWNGKNDEDEIVANGIYVVKAKIGKVFYTKKITLIKSGVTYER